MKKGKGKTALQELMEMPKEVLAKMLLAEMRKKQPPRPPMKTLNLREEFDEVLVLLDEKIAADAAAYVTPDFLK